MIITLENIIGLLKRENPVKKSRVYGRNTINQYILLETLEIELSNKYIVVIPKGYIWDLASVPRLLWWLFPTDSDAELSFLIHDYLYENRIGNRNFADSEMLIWSSKLSGRSKTSLRNIDNKTRYMAVKWFGQRAWKN
jgi:hypothetical protein